MQFIFWLLVALGAATACLNGWNAVASEATWKHDAVWSLSAFGGVGLIILTLLLRKWGLL